MARAKKTESALVVCIDNGGYPASLELRKIYRLLPDLTAAAHGQGIRGCYLTSKIPARLHAAPGLPGGSSSSVPAPRRAHGALRQIIAQLQLRGHDAGIWLGMLSGGPVEDLRTVTGRQERSMRKAFEVPTAEAASAQPIGYDE